MFDDGHLLEDRQLRGPKQDLRRGAAERWRGIARRAALSVSPFESIAVRFHPGSFRPAHSPTGPREHGTLAVFFAFPNP